MDTIVDLPTETLDEIWLEIKLPFLHIVWLTLH